MNSYNFILNMNEAFFHQHEETANRGSHTQSYRLENAHHVHMYICCSCYIIVIFKPHKSSHVYYQAQRTMFFERMFCLNALIYAFVIWFRLYKWWTGDKLTILIKIKMFSDCWWVLLSLRSPARRTTIVSFVQAEKWTANQYAPLLFLQ